MIHKPLSEEENICLKCSSNSEALMILSSICSYKSLHNIVLPIAKAYLAIVYGAIIGYHRI